MLPENHPASVKGRIFSFKSFTVCAVKLTSSPTFFMTLINLLPVSTSTLLSICLTTPIIVFVKERMPLPIILNAIAAP